MVDIEKQELATADSIQPVAASPQTETEETKSPSVQSEMINSSSDPEKNSTSFGATIERTTSNLQIPPRPFLKGKPSATTITTVDTPPSPKSINSSDETPVTNPFSAFYTHPPCSFERSKIAVNVYANDLESQCQITTSPKISIEQTKDCAMWPSQQELKRRHKAHKKARRSPYNLCARMNKRTKAIVFGISLLLIIGIALALAIPISIHMGTGIWASSSQPNKPITG